LKAKTHASILEARNQAAVSGETRSLAAVSEARIHAAV
jgi:hypothetical protein